MTTDEIEKLEKIYKLIKNRYEEEYDSHSQWYGHFEWILDKCEYELENILNKPKE